MESGGSEHWSIGIVITGIPKDVGLSCSRKVHGASTDTEKERVPLTAGRSGARAASQDVFTLPNPESPHLSCPSTSGEIISLPQDMPEVRDPALSALIIYTLPLAPMVLALEPE